MITQMQNDNRELEMHCVAHRSVCGICIAHVCMGGFERERDVDGNNSMSVSGREPASQLFIRK